MDAYGQMLAKLLRLMPPPAPQKGWGLVRMMAAAQILGPIAEYRMVEAQYGLRLGATQSRIDNAPTSWATAPSTWAFEVQGEVGGAQSFYLDAWGNILGVPRILNEPDSHFRQRILFQAAQASQTNQGLASTIQNATGVQGVQVLDAATLVPPCLLNDGKTRLNGGARLNNQYFGNGNLNCCFYTVVPGPFDEPSLMRIVQRSKAAGTRHLGILARPVTTPIISAPGLVAYGSAFGATVAAIPGATMYTWTASSGAILSGQGLAAVQVQAPLAGGEVTLQVVATTPGGPSQPGTAQVFLDVAVPTVVFCNLLTAPAGESGLAASVVAGMATYLWSITNGTITSGQGTHQILFSSGEGGGVCTLTCAMVAPHGLAGTASGTLDVLPFPYTYTWSNPAMAVQGSESASLPFGHAWLITAISATQSVRVRAYASAAQRALDAGRSLGVQPNANSGLLAEAVTGAGEFNVPFKPYAFGACPDGNAYLQIDNMGPLGNVSVTFSTIMQEA